MRRRLRPAGSPERRAGSRRQRVTLSATIESGELLIRVEDYGPGIPEEQLPHILERFYRVEKGRARKQGGTELGLSIAQTIVQAHGGRIEAESRVGEGTKMSLRLPLDAELEQSGRTTNLGARDGRTRVQDHA